MKSVYEHYTEQAKIHGKNATSTMADVVTRRKELEELALCLQLLIPERFGYSGTPAPPKVLEIGCGNGWAAENLSRTLKIPLTCIDYNKEMIDVAKQRKLKDVSFEVGDALDLHFTSNHFDIVFTERCLINLLDWKEKKRALLEIHRVLRKGGTYLMLEAFTDGLEEMNSARLDVGLESTPEPFHNKFFDKGQLLRFLDDKFKLVSTSNFLSTYYFGSRVLYPALIKPNEPKYNTAFVKFFSDLPPYGNYSSIQLCVLQKVD